MKYDCSCCGETHENMPDLCFDRPDYADSIPDEEAGDRVELDTDLCTVDNEYFFIRAVLLIPITETNERLGFGVWVSQKKENFETYLDNYESSDIGPFFGWLSNELNYGGVSTLSMKTMVSFQGNGQRPMVRLEESDHPLYLAQKNGISMDDAWETVHGYVG